MTTPEPENIPGISSPSRAATVAGLVTGAAGILILWASGVAFPVVPPGLVILVVAAGLVALAPWRWTPAVGTLVGLFLTVGFVTSGATAYLFGTEGMAVLVGSWVQLAGVLTALISGVIATRANYRKSTPAQA